MTDSPQVIFATPTLSHSFSAHYMRSMQETQWLLSAAGISSGCMVRAGDCFVDKARNKLVTDFLRQFPESPMLFFIDDDVGWEPAKVVEFIRRPDAVVAGVYPKKGETRDFPVSLMMHPETGELIESQGLYLAILAPTGFMRIRREVLEQLSEKATVFEDLEPDGKYHSYAYIFESGRGENGTFWGEDYTFCRKVQDAGINIWIDPEITFKHMGLRTWEDRLADHLDVYRDRAKKAFANGVDKDGNPHLTKSDAA